MDKLSRLIRLARKKKRNMPLVTVADKVGVSYGVMQKIEAGTMKTYPDRELLHKICVVLEIDYVEAVDSLYAFIEEQTPLAQSVQANMVPIINWSDLHVLRDGVSFSEVQSEDHLVSSYSSKDVIGVRAPISYHSTFFTVPTLLIFEETSHFSHMDYVLFYNSDSSQFEVRLYEQTKKGNLLRSVDLQLPTQFITKENKESLFGVLIETRNIKV